MQFQPKDWIAIFIFTHLFHFGVILLLVGSWLGGISLYFTWNLWTAYERWRINELRN